MEISRFHDMGSWLVGNINGLKPLLFMVIVNYRKHGAAASPWSARRSTRPPGRARRRGRRRRWRACSECPLLWCAGRRLMGRHINLQRRQPHLNNSDTRQPARARVSAGDAKWERKETPFDFKRNQFMVIYPFLEPSTPIQNTLTGVQHCQL